MKEEEKGPVSPWPAKFEARPELALPPPPLHALELHHDLAILLVQINVLQQTPSVQNGHFSVSLGTAGIECAPALRAECALPRSRRENNGSSSEFWA